MTVILRFPGERDRRSAGQPELFFYATHGNVRERRVLLVAHGALEHDLHVLRLLDQLERGLAQVRLDLVRVKVLLGLELLLERLGQLGVR